MFIHSKSNHVNFAKLYRSASKLVRGLPPVKRRRKRNFVFKIFKYTGFVFIITGLLIGGYVAVHLFSFKFLFESAMTGRDNIEYALELVGNRDFDSAINFAQAAEESFSLSLEKVGELENTFIVENWSVARDQVGELKNVFEAAAVLSHAVNEGAELGSSFYYIMGEKKSFTVLSDDEKTGALKLFHESGKEFDSLKSDIDKAYSNLNKVRARGLLLPLRGKIRKYQAQLKEVKVAMDTAAPMTKIVPALFGYPEKSAYLVILQNSDELRPTGGFIGTYGILETENGDIARLDTHDIYHMDMPVKDKLDVKPPEPLVKYLGVDKWYMRDSNWSPHWPVAANKILDFYKAEDALLPEKDQINNFEGEFDGVIGFTPAAVTSLIEFTGPITVDGEEYNKDNFVDLLQYKVEKGYVQEGTPSWQRKEVIGEIVKELKLIILNKPLNEVVDAFSKIGENLAAKNIIVYFKDPNMEDLVVAQGWSGGLVETENDYVMIVDANMAALKTDAVIDRNISYKIDQDINGLYGDLTIYYSHSGDFDWKTTRYRSYTRVYVPLGSELIRAGGFSEEEVTTSSELGKTVFNVFLSVEPGKIGRLHLYYKLPAEIENKVKNGSYNLYLQRQPGTQVENLDVNLRFNKIIKEYAPTGFYVTHDNNKVFWSSDLDTDKEFSVIFN